MEYYVSIAALLWIYDHRKGRTLSNQESEIKMISPVKTGDFKKALSFVLKWEGGYANDPDDSGGATNFGITQKTYDAWRNGQPHKDVRDISLSEVEKIYYEMYWKPIKGDMLPEGIAMAVFDGAVNSGVSRSSIWLQMAVGTNTDGVIGPITLSAVANKSPNEILDSYIDNRNRFLNNISTKGNNAKFLKGWLRRTAALKAAALA